MQQCKQKENFKRHIIKFIAISSITPKLFKKENTIKAEKINYKLSILN